VSNNNAIVSNIARSNLGIGIELEDSFRNSVRQNSANSNHAYGMSVAGVAASGQGNTLDGNTANSNGSDGINVSGSGHTIRNNIARFNNGWGIYAAPGNVDGGGTERAATQSPLSASASAAPPSRSDARGEGAPRGAPSHCRLGVALTGKVCAA
jgi:parallel beta-helix repeat protein